MTVDRVEELVRYWRDYPPAHLLVRWAVGYDPPKEDDRMDAAALARQFGGKVVSRGG